MASSRQNSSQMLNSQSSSSNSTSSTNSKDKTVHTKSDAKNKHGKVIHKFTSESYLRIICEKSSTTASNNDKKLLLVDKSSSPSSGGGHIPMSSNTIINSMNNMSKRKGTSFQITSVSVSSGNNQQQQQQPQQQRSADNNNGDDSADESHTDDNISRITDYETPSFSEDTFSREDVFFAQPNAFGTAPVIPTSSQYGLAIVGPDMGGNGANLSDVHVSVTDAGINIMGQLPNKQDVDHKNERFKVVKIESTEPFKRGRWMCMDYLDHTTLQAQDDGIDGSPKEEGAGDENVVRTKDSGLESEGGEAMQVNDNGDLEHMNDIDGYDQEVMQAEMMNHHHYHHQGESHASQHESQQQHEISMHHQSQGAQGHEINTQTTESKMENPSSDTLPAAPTSQFPQIPQGGYQNNPFVDPPNMNVHHTQSLTPDMIQRSLQQENLHLQQHQHHHVLHQQHPHGTTLPTNVLLHKLGLDQQQNLLLQQQQHLQSQLKQQQQQMNNASNNATSSPLPSDNSSGEMENRHQHQQLQDSQTNQFQNQQVGAGDKQLQQPSNESDQQQQQLSGHASTNDNIINNSVSDNSNMNSGNDGTNTLSPSSSAGLGTVAEGGGSGAIGGDLNNANNAAATGADDGQSLNEDSER